MMGFSQEWESTYQTGTHNGVWPWADVVSKTNRYFKGKSGLRVLELGCGAGANIPFFAAFGAEYCGIEGSITEAHKLNQRFAGENVIVKQADFTKDIPFDGEFDLILDRGALTCNTTMDIQDTIRLALKHLKSDGYFFGIDWISMNDSTFAENREQFEAVDPHTRVFQSGYYKGLGNIHFSDEKHIRELFSAYEIVELYEKREIQILPKEQIMAWWNFVVKK